jgi:hypothetical protein
LPGADAEHNEELWTNGLLETDTDQSYIYIALRDLRELKYRNYAYHLSGFASVISLYFFTV